MLFFKMKPEKFDQNTMDKIFFKNADVEKDGEKNLSFDKFSMICVDYGLFSDEA